MTKSKGVNKQWSPSELNKLSRYLKSGLSYAECAKLLDCTSFRIRYAARRKGFKLTTEEVREHQRNAGRDRRGAVVEDRTTKQVTEPWVEYTARKQREREAKKNGSSR